MFLKRWIGILSSTVYDLLECKVLIVAYSRFLSGIERKKRLKSVQKNLTKSELQMMCQNYSNYAISCSCV